MPAFSTAPCPAMNLGLRIKLPCSSAGWKKARRLRGGSSIDGFLLPSFERMLFLQLLQSRMHVSLKLRRLLHQ